MRRTALTETRIAAAAAAGLWAASVSLDMAGHDSLPLRWRLLLLAASLATLIWALHARDRAGAKRDRPDGRVVTDEEMELILDAAAAGYRAASGENAPPAPAAPVRLAWSAGRAPLGA